MRHRIRVPALGEHRDGDHAANLGAKLARLAHRVQDFAQDLVILDVVRAAAREPRDVLALVFLDLPRRGLLEDRVQGVSAVQLH